MVKISNMLDINNLTACTIHSKPPMWVDLLLGSFMRYYTCVCTFIIAHNTEYSDQEKLQPGRRKQHKEKKEKATQNQNSLLISRVCCRSYSSIRDAENVRFQDGDEKTRILQS